MGLNLILPPQIEAEWEHIGAALASAIKCDETRQVPDVYRDLMAGDMALFQMKSRNANGFVVIEFTDAEPKCCWIVYVAGAITGSHRQWLGRVRVLMSYFEGIARAHDCTEMRIEGRDWSRVFPKWERVTDRPDRNELRRSL